jgi:hypothetical protein
MPYISQDKRDEVKRDRFADTPAKLAFICLQAAMDYLRTQPTRNWDTLSNAHKAMVCAEREFYRRHLAPYEDEAIARNGDLY